VPDGRAHDPSAVVDPRCRFIGVEALSVDASIIPVIPRANTHLTAVMIAERAASFLTS
jgi:choline dehydrogenase-like flavoprotein